MGEESHPYILSAAGRLLHNQLRDQSRMDIKSDTEGKSFIPAVHDSYEKCMDTIWGKGCSEQTKRIIRTSPSENISLYTALHLYWNIYAKKKNSKRPFPDNKISGFYKNISSCGIALSCHNSRNFQLRPKQNWKVTWVPVSGGNDIQKSIPISIIGLQNNGNCRSRSSG